MTGPHIARLQAAIAGMDPDDVATSRTHWDQGAASLRNIAGVLESAEASILEGFGPSSLVGPAAKQAFATMRTNVLGPRQVEMRAAGEALDVVRMAMLRARATSAQMPTSSPGTPPTFTAGTGDEADDVTRLKIHAAQMRTHQQQTAAYAESDERARQELVALDRDYDEAAEVMARIHGEPVPESGAGTSGSDPGGAGGASTGSAHGAGAASSSGGGQSATIDTAFPSGGDTFEVSPTSSSTTGATPYSAPQGTPDTDLPGAGTDVGDTGVATGGSGLNPIAGGAAAGAGALGVLGAKNLIARLGSAAPGGTAAGGTPARPVGATGRTASSGVLGGSAARGAAGTSRTSGSQASGRGASAGTGAGARAGAGAGAAGRRGRTDEREPSRENDLEVEEDWLDDEGHAGVLG